jgi:preprotein translocase subunit SecA
MISLEMIDNLWVDHLEAMEHLRSSVNLRSYGQRDPLVEYKREGLRMFKSFDANFKNSLIGLLPHIEAISEKISGPLVPAFDMAKIETKFEGQENINSSKPAATGEKLGRNDICHCGSGKKYKKCCMNN